MADEKKPVEVLPSSSSGKPKPVGVSVNDCCICKNFPLSRTRELPLTETVPISLQASTQ